MKYLLIGLLLTISLSVSAQSEEKKTTEPNYIEVTGKAEMDVVPDLIYLKILISEKDLKSKQTLEEIEKSMTSMLSELGIDISKDLSIKDFVSNFKYSFLSKTDIVLKKEYQLIVHDAKTLQKTILELQKLGISNVSIEKLDHTKITQFRKEIKINAIKAAKEKAESLISSINQTIGKAIYVKEIDNQSGVNSLQGRVAGVNVIARGTKSIYDSNETQFPDLEFEKINLEYSILVRFELK